MEQTGASRGESILECARFLRSGELTGLATEPVQETAEEQKRRFEIECEFVQALANPHYLNCKLP